MELLKKNIHMNRLKDKNSFNITVDEDCVIPNSHPDIVRKIRECGDVCVEKIRGMEDKAGISGMLSYSFLYASQDSYQSVYGKIPFEETVAMQGITPQDILSCKVVLEDIKISVVNSRKISVRAIISVSIMVEEICDIETVGALTAEDARVKNSEVEMLKLCGVKREIFRVRESLVTDKEMGNIGDIIWYELLPCEMDYKCTDDGVLVKGFLDIFVIYAGETDRDKIYCFKGRSPFSGTIPMSDWNEDVCLVMNVISMEKSLITRVDANSENRIFDGEVLMNMDIRGYKREKIQLLEDAISPKWNLEFIRKPMDYRRIVEENKIDCKVNGKFRVNNPDKIFVCDSTVYVEDVYVNDKGVNVEGIISTELCYHTGDEKEPINSGKFAIPFSKIIEVLDVPKECMTELCISDIHTEWEHLSAEEIKIDVEMTITAVTCVNTSTDVIVDVKESAVNPEIIKCMPGLTGYIVQKGDTLWNIAKKYRTTVENIMETNNLSTDEIFPGMKLIIVKLYCF